jgi:predicted deacylase
VNAVPHFSQSYAEARAKFLAVAGSRDLVPEAHFLPGHVGVDGEALAMDVAIVAAPGAEGVLVLTSATHGIEGYCGSGVQVALLNDDAFLRAARKARVAVLFIHAVNPHGFSHGRRVNEDNADLNRNFRDFDAPPPVNGAYADVHVLLIPPTWPPAPGHEKALAAYIAAHGARAFQTAVTGGQYAFADGLFYGGARPAWSNATVRHILRRHASGHARVGWIDFHTGLGPRGHGEKIFAGRDNPLDFARARAWWGGEVTSIYDDSSSSAKLTGLMCNAAYDECPDAQFTGIGLEYGTVPLPEVLQALRADHWLHNHPEAREVQRAEIGKQMRDAFYVDTDEWKEQVYAQARAAALAALAPLAAGSPSR